MTASSRRSILYFAYGSNLLESRLRAPERTPGAICRGQASLDEHQLRFHKRGRDGSGKADAFFTGSPVHQLHGRVYELPLGELVTLDRVEGVGFGYERVTVSVTLGTLGLVDAQTYRALEPAIDPGIAPFDWYLNLVRAGAAEIDLPASHQESLRVISSIVDPDVDRRERARALLPVSWQAPRPAGRARSPS